MSEQKSLFHEFHGGPHEGRPDFDRPRPPRPPHEDRPDFDRPRPPRPPREDRPGFDRPRSPREDRPPRGDRPDPEDPDRPHPPRGSHPYPPRDGRSSRPFPSRFGHPGSEGSGRPRFSGGSRPSGRKDGHHSAAPARPSAPSPARRLALQVLTDVHKNDAYASLSLNSHLAEGYYSPEDRRLATALVYGVLENELKLDYALSRFMEHPATDVYMKDLLRMGAFQLLMMDRIPDSAAVNDAVNMAKQAAPSAAGMINGVLRNLARGRDEIPWPKKEENFSEWLSVMSSTPLWLTDRLIRDWGEEEAERLLMYREQEHPLILRPNLTRLSDAEFEKLLSRKAWQSRRGEIPHAWAVTGASAIPLDNDYRSGLFSIQGQSSMMAAEAVSPANGSKVLDACAAPGGKAAYLCESMQLTGRVYAWELHEKRARLIEGVKRRLGLDNLRVAVRDASQYREDFDSAMDAVLLDAPCSGLGVLAQKPDIKHRLKAEDLPEIEETQKKLLDTVCRYVRPGGTLVYSTCSVLPAENSRQIESFLERHPEFTMDPLPASIPECFRQKQGAFGLQLMPGQDGVEGFFIARMRRQK